MGLHTWAMYGGAIGGRTVFTAPERMPASAERVGAATRPDIDYHIFSCGRLAGLDRGSLT